MNLTRLALGLALVACVGCSKSELKSEIKQEIQFDLSNVKFEPSERATQEQIIAQADSLNEFSFSLYSNLKKKSLIVSNENSVISPFSVRTAMSMLYGAAEKEGQAQNELGVALNLKGAEDSLHLALKSQLLSMSDSVSGGNVYELVNQIFVDKKKKLNPDYLDTLKTTFNVGVGKLDFSSSRSAAEESRRQINEFVSLKTKNLINDLLPQKSIDTDTQSVLLNALYLKAEWEKPFESGSTSPDIFTLSDGTAYSVPTMVDSDSYAYYQDEQIEALSKPYKGNGLAMMFIVPKTGVGLEAVEDALDSKKMLLIQDQLSDKSVRLFLPKFKFSWGTKSLASSLKSMGINLAFQNVMPFPRFFSDVSDPYISDVFHQAVLGVDEQGAEAAAATAVVLTKASAPLQRKEPIVFRVNKPSLFYIYEKRTHAILFMGRLSKP